jgi:glycosidase
MLYLIMPDRFANGNPNDSDAATKKNNRDLPGRQAATFKG